MNMDDYRCYEEFFNEIEDCNHGPGQDRPMIAKDEISLPGRMLL
jgi:hypothetical protein